LLIAVVIAGLSAGLIAGQFAVLIAGLLWFGSNWWECSLIGGDRDAWRVFPHSLVFDGGTNFGHKHTFRIFW